jgi:hypothetical protein
MKFILGPVFLSRGNPLTLPKPPMRYILALFFLFLFSLPIHGALDPRERYGTFLGGGHNKCVANTSGDLRCADGQLVSYGPATTIATAVTTDAAGNVYVAGYTDAVDFPTTTGAYSRSAALIGTHICCLALSDDTFVMKFNASGQLVWSTYLNLPTNGTQTPFNRPGIVGLAVDASANVYVASEYSDSNVNLSPVLIKLNPSGSAVLFSFSGAGLFYSGSLQFVSSIARFGKPCLPCRDRWCYGRGCGHEARHQQAGGEFHRRES